MKEDLERTREIDKARFQLAERARKSEECFGLFTWHFVLYILSALLETTTTTTTVELSFLSLQFWREKVLCVVARKCNGERERDLCVTQTDAHRRTVLGKPDQLMMALTNGACEYAAAFATLTDFHHWIYICMFGPSLSMHVSLSHCVDFT